MLCDRAPASIPFLLGAVVLALSPGVADEPAQDPAKAQKPEDSLPALPSKDLPPATRTKPDPAKMQYVREAVFVSVDRQIQPEPGKVYAQSVKEIEKYLKEYLRRSGHPIVDDPKAAAFRVEGKLAIQFDKTLTVLGQVTAWKFVGSSEVYVLDSTGAQLETYSVPELYQETGKSAESCILNLERHMAKIQWDKMTSSGKVFTHAKVVSLINSLASQAEGAAAPTTADVVKSLADIGFPAVPYLLEALTDNRSVRIPATYPGLAGRSLDDLRVYHIADKALEEIFQKVSRMSIEIGAEEPDGQRKRLVIIKGWENEWRRFAKSYAESPHAPEARARAAAASPAPSGTDGGASKKSAEPAEKGR